MLPRYLGIGISVAVLAGFVVGFIGPGKVFKATGLADGLQRVELRMRD